MPNDSDGPTCVYLDTSALAKLIVIEAESTELRAWLDERKDLVRISSSLVRSELPRAVGRHGPDATGRAGPHVRRMTLVPMNATLLDEAGRLAPPELRTLDAIHLATAVRLMDTLEAVVTYDTRMITAARSLGLTVAHPGLTLG